MLQFVLFLPSEREPETLTGKLPPALFTQILVLLQGCLQGTEEHSRRPSNVVDTDKRGWLLDVNLQSRCLPALSCQLSNMSLHRDIRNPPRDFRRAKSFEQLPTGRRSAWCASQKKGPFVFRLWPGCLRHIPSHHDQFLSLSLPQNKQTTLVALQFWPTFFNIGRSERARDRPSETSKGRVGGGRMCSYLFPR